MISRFLSWGWCCGLQHRGGASWRRQLFGRLAWRAGSPATTSCICRSGSCSGLRRIVCRAVRVDTLGRRRGSLFRVAVELGVFFGFPSSMSPVVDRGGSARGKSRRRLSIAAWCFLPVGCCVVQHGGSLPGVGEIGRLPAGRFQLSNYYYTLDKGICQWGTFWSDGHLPHRNGHPHEQDNQNGEQNCEAPHASSS